MPDLIEFLSNLPPEYDVMLTGDDGEIPLSCPICEALTANHEALRDTLMEIDWRLNNMRPADDLAQLQFVKVQTLLAQALNISKRMAGV